MRKREEIEEEKTIWANRVNDTIIQNPYEVVLNKLSLEVLLDIRDLLQAQQIKTN